MSGDSESTSNSGKEAGREGEGPCGCSDSEHGTSDHGMGEGLMPKVTFSTFVLSLGSSAMVHLGEAPEPETGQISENLCMAKHTIDILSMLKDKTSRCLDSEETTLLEGLLYELRLKYVVKAQ